MALDQQIIQPPSHRSHPANQQPNHRNQIIQPPSHHSTTQPPNPVLCFFLFQLLLQDLIVAFQRSRRTQNVHKHLDPVHELLMVEFQENGHPSPTEGGCEKEKKNTHTHTHTDRHTTHARGVSFGCSFEFVTLDRKQALIDKYET